MVGFGWDSPEGAPDGGDCGRTAERSLGRRSVPGTGWKHGGLVSTCGRRRLKGRLNGRGGRRQPSVTPAGGYARDRLALTELGS